MKIILVLAAGLGLAVSTAEAGEARIGVDVGPVGAGATVGRAPDRDRERTTVITREREPRERTTIIRREREEPANKVIIKEYERD